MSLGINIIRKTDSICECCGNKTITNVCIYSDNITHNLNQMAKEANLYDALWNAWNLNASEIIEPLKKGLKTLKSNPEYFKQFNHNNWGTYDNLVLFVEKYLKACIDNPNDEIYITR